MLGRAGGGVPGGEPGGGGTVIVTGALGLTTPSCAHAGVLAATSSETAITVRFMLTPRPRPSSTFGGHSVSALRLEQKERLSVLDGLAVLHEDLHDPARRLRLDLVHQLHRFDDAEDLAF